MNEKILVDRLEKVGFKLQGFNEQYKKLAADFEASERTIMKVRHLLLEDNPKEALSVINTYVLESFSSAISELPTEEREKVINELKND